MKVFTVKYQTERQHCQCCGHKLDKPEKSGMREFNIREDDFLAWMDIEDWRFSASDENELKVMVEEFVLETISFFATSSDVTIAVYPSEFKRMEKFILQELL